MIVIKTQNDNIFQNGHFHYNILMTQIWIVLLFEAQLTTVHWAIITFVSYVAFTHYLFLLTERAELKLETFYLMALTKNKFLQRILT